MVLEEGTFKLSGRVVDGDERAPVSQATVAIESGTGTGLTTVTGENGQYVIYGAAGDVRLRGAAEGFASSASTVAVAGHTTQDITLTPLAAAAELSGRWSLTITAVSECSDDLPEPARSRQFEASLAHQGSTIALLASSPSARSAEALAGRIFGNTITARIRYWPGDVIEFPEYGLLDAIDPRGLLGIWGTIQATIIDSQRVDGLLTGGLHFYPNVLTFGGHAGCDGQVASVHLRRSG